MNSVVRNILIGVLCCTVLPVMAQTDYEVQIAHYEWPQDDSVDEVLMIPQFRSVLSRYNELESAVLIIRYPGGDQGNAWAISLRNSLVSLGVRMSDILLEPGSGIPETLLLIISESYDY